MHPHTSVKSRRTSSSPDGVQMVVQVGPPDGRLNLCTYGFGRPSHYWVYIGSSIVVPADQWHIYMLPADHSNIEQHGMYIGTDRL